MKAPTEQWCVQIDVTNVCDMKCSNCTRVLAHVVVPFFMSLETFERAVASVRTFPKASVPDVEGRKKVIGVIGGEPTLHPQFTEICRIMEELLPDKKTRGLWTNCGPKYKEHRVLIDRVFGYQNKQPHKPPVRHQPVLIASRDAVKDKDKRLKLIYDCWLQNSWASSITPRGVWYCEVAGALDMVFQDTPGRLPIEPLWWNRSMLDFHDQILHHCNRCGVCLPLPGRLDGDEMDDVSPTNLKRLEAIRSPGLARLFLHTMKGYNPAKYEETWSPRRYRDMKVGELIDGSL